MHRRAAEALARLRPHDTEASLLAVRCPLLHVSGSFPSDRDRLRALCPQLEVADVHGRGHFIQLTAAEEVNAVLAHFLARVTGSVTSTSSGQGGLRATVGPTRPR
jgi:pimeloyl-ACP methyl ester carboxylesterase